jgi:hypothetical protein
MMVMMETLPDFTGRKQDTRFKRGQSGNPAGRPKGARNKVSEKLLEALALDFDTHGKAVIEKVRSDRPHEYLKIVASLVPKQMEIESTAQPFAIIPQEVESAEAWEKAVAESQAEHRGQEEDCPERSATGATRKPDL